MNLEGCLEFYLIRMMYNSVINHVLFINFVLILKRLVVKMQAKIFLEPRYHEIGISNIGEDFLWLVYCTFIQIQHVE